MEPVSRDSGFRSMLVSRDAFEKWEELYREKVPSKDYESDHPLDHTIHPASHDPSHNGPLWLRLTR